MKSKIFIQILSLCLFAIFINFSFIRCGTHSGRKKTFNNVLGCYVLDLSKTKLEGYNIDSNTYKKLALCFFSDSTFKLNMNVPFMYNDRGKWKAGNVNEWCWLLFDGFQYDYNNKNSGSQFTRPYIENIDTFILVNAATPKDDEKTISNLYFRKVKS